MPSVFDVLAQDHAEVKRMLAELELGPTAATGADADQLALRKRMVQQLVIEVSKHEAVEEMYFWPAVRSHVSDGTDLANQAQGQEQEGKEVLARLDKLAPEDEAFDPPDQTPEWFYIVRFNLSQLWYGYTGTDSDTLQTEIPQRWLEAVA